MKKTFIYACIALAFASCDKVKQLANINQNLTYTETISIPELPGGIDTLPPGGVAAYFPGQGIPTNSQDYLNQFGTTAALITHVKMTKLAAVITQPSGANFDFIDTINVYLSANGLDEKLVAYKHGISKGLTSIDLDCPSDINLKEYFLKDTMYLRFGGHFVGVPKSDSKIDLTSTFNLLANPLNK
jgi:hypothetical protein